MSRDGEVVRAYERLAAALSSKIVDADHEDVMASHAGRGGRVAAESLRQHIRRIGLARRDDLGAESCIASMAVPARPVRRRSHDPG